MHYWYQNLGDGRSFRKHTIFYGAQAKYYGDGACAEDVNADGKADVVGSYSRVGYFRQVTPDSFVLAELDTITDSHWIRTANLDYKPNGSDADIDILVAGRGQFAWYENDVQFVYSTNGWLASSILDAGTPATWRTLAWDAVRPGGTRLDFFVRSGTTPGQCTTETWKGPISVRTGVQLDSAAITQYTGTSHRYFQYRAAMGGDRAVTPAVYSVRVVFDGVGPVHDVGTTAILAPGAVADTLLKVTPSATVANYGSDAETFYVLFTISRTNGTPVYRDSVPTTLASGASELRIFRDFQFTELGPYEVRCSTCLPTDQNRSNDAQFHVCKAVGRPPWPSGWYEVAPMPSLPSGKVVKKGGWLTFMAGAGRFFGAKGNKVGDFYVYDPGPDTWGVRKAVPAGGERKFPSGGAAGTSDGRRFVYATKGNNTLGFWCYDVVLDTWHQLTDVPAGIYRKKARAGTDLAFVPKQDTDYVYLLKGGKNEFYRYNTAARRWDEMPMAPQGASLKWDRGSWLAYDDERFIYAHKGKYSELWRFDTRADTWLDTMLPGIPVYNPTTHQNKKARDGSAAAWCDSAIYALKGANTQDFWEYDVAEGAWSDLDTIPAYGSAMRRVKVKDGADLAAFGDGVFFALKGARTCEFWRYTLNPEIIAPAPARGVAATGGTTLSRWQLVLVPSPTAGRRVSLFGAPTGRLVLYDVMGRVCRTQMVAAGGGAVSLDLAGLAAGAYPVRLETPSGTYSGRLILR